MYHYGCNENVVEGTNYCASCTTGTLQQLGYIYVDEANHRPFYKYSCCRTYTYIQSELSPYTMVNGVCSGCQYNANSYEVATAPTAEEIHVQKAAEVEAKQKKVVTTATGETLFPICTVLLKMVKSQN